MKTKTKNCVKCGEQFEARLQNNYITYQDFCSKCGKKKVWWR